MVVWLWYLCDMLKIMSLRLFICILKCDKLIMFIFYYGGLSCICDIWDFILKWVVCWVLFDCVRVILLNC